MTVLLVLGGLAALVGLAHGLRRCSRLIQEGKTQARRRADAARAIEVPRLAYERDTIRLEAALAPLFDPAITGSTAGFGDALVAEERLRTAFRSIAPQPDLVEETF